MLSPATVLAILERLLPAAANGRVCIAFSGGLDSTVLLHALAAAMRDSLHRLRAIHIDHQLHPESSLWQEHCAEVARAAGIAYLSERVTVPTDTDTGIEAAARTVRYAALRRLLVPGETLVTAQHADDQLETVLLALLRGAGVNGLAAMPACQRFGEGWHARPLLTFSRASLEEWARNERLTWITDPSNDNIRFSRNYLRREVLPALKQRWPDAAASAARAAAHLGQAIELLDALAATDLEAAAAGPCLKVAALAALDSNRRRNLLRFWVRSRGARTPSTEKLAALEHDMLAAQGDRLPCIRWDDFEVRRHRGLLYGGPRLEKLQTSEPAMWNWRNRFELPADLGALRTESARGGGLAIAKLPTHVTISFRRGGEMLRPAGHPQHRELRKLLQEANILPWWRNRVPLLHVGGELAAVGDLWVADEFATRVDEPGARVVWEGRPDIEAQPVDDG